MSEIKFERRYDTLTILNPLKGFTVERQQLEMRWDPLLRHISLYNPGIEDGLKSFIGEADWALLEQLAAESAGRCFFCPERIELTARYPDTFIPGGRLTVGEATLFPNIFALAPYHAVIAVSRAHWLPPGGFTPRLIRDALELAWQYNAAVFDVDHEAAYATVNANYLFPAGASILHPHFQALVSRAPYTHQERLLQACTAYLKEKGSAFYDDLLVTERRIGRTLHRPDRQLALAGQLFTARRKRDHRGSHRQWRFHSTIKRGFGQPGRRSCGCTPLLWRNGLRGLQLHALFTPLSGRKRRLSQYHPLHDPPKPLS